MKPGTRPLAGLTPEPSLITMVVSHPLFSGIVHAHGEGLIGLRWSFFLSSLFFNRFVFHEVISIL